MGCNQIKYQNSQLETIKINKSMSQFITKSIIQKKNKKNKNLKLINKITVYSKLKKNLNSESIMEIFNTLIHKISGNGIVRHYNNNIYYSLMMKNFLDLENENFDFNNIKNEIDKNFKKTKNEIYLLN
jgi:hypothetical protein